MSCIMHYVSSENDLQIGNNIVALIVNRKGKDQGNVPMIREHT